MSEARSRLTKLTADCGDYKQEKQVYRTKQATVEVTVKVKKRRHPEPAEAQAKVAPLPEKTVFPKGSWGDLLSQNRKAEVVEVVKDAKSKIQRKEIKCVSEDGDNHKTLCHRIPISDDLYLETHTHVKSRSPSSHSKAAVVDRDRSHKQQRFVAENEFLRTEINRLRQEVETVKLQNRKKKETYRAIKKSSALPPRPSTQKGSPSRHLVSRESKQTSTTNIVPLVEKRSGVTQTDGKSPVKPATASMSVENSNKKNDHLEMENQALRNEAAQLLNEMKKAKQEQQESIMTIKELYQMAELLKRENQELLGAQEQQQFMQEKLVEALTENQDLKGYLDSLVQKQTESSHDHDDQLAKIRNVIQEVKSTIATEIQGITSHSQSSLYGQPEAIRAFDFNISEGGSALLNDTNASEIQRIFGSLTSLEESRRKKGEDESLATAALKACLLTPPPTTSHRGSNPASRSSSRGSGRSSGKEDSYKRNEIPSDGSKDDHMESLRQDISRSFKPIQMELNASSSSEYRSTTSTPTNIMP